MMTMMMYLRVWHSSLLLFFHSLLTALAILRYLGAASVQGPCVKFRKC